MYANIAIANKKHIFISEVITCIRKISHRFICYPGLDVHEKHHTTCISKGFLCRLLPCHKLLLQLQTKGHT